MSSKFAHIKKGSTFALEIDSQSGMTALFLLIAFRGS